MAYGVFERLGLSDQGALALYREPFRDAEQQSISIPEDVRRAYAFLKDKFFCSFRDRGGNVLSRNADGLFAARTPDAGSDVVMTPFGAPVIAQGPKVLTDEKLETNLRTIARYEAAQAGIDFDESEFQEDMIHLKRYTPTRGDVWAYYTDPSKAAVHLHHPVITLNPGSVLTVVPPRAPTEVFYSERNWPAAMNGTRQSPCGIADRAISESIMAETNEEMAIAVAGRDASGAARVFLLTVAQGDENGYVTGIDGGAKLKQWDVRHGGNPTVAEQLSEKFGYDVTGVTPEEAVIGVTAGATDRDVTLRIEDENGATLETVRGVMLAEQGGTGLTIDQSFDLSEGVRELIAQAGLYDVQISVAEPESFGRVTGVLPVADIILTAKLDAAGKPMVLDRLKNVLEAKGLAPAIQAAPTPVVRAPQP